MRKKSEKVIRSIGKVRKVNMEKTKQVFLRLATIRILLSRNHIWSQLNTKKLQAAAL